MGFIWTILIGFIIGVVAKLLHPGKENFGFIMTTILGVVGSMTAAVVGKAIGWYAPDDTAGFIASVIAAIILLVVYTRVVKK